jgi:hypothetical protein
MFRFHLARLFLLRRCTPSAVPADAMLHDIVYDAGEVNHRLTEPQHVKRVVFL